MNQFSPGLGKKLAKQQSPELERTAAEAQLQHEARDKLNNDEIHEIDGHLRYRFSQEARDILWLFEGLFRQKGEKRSKVNRSFTNPMYGLIQFVYKS